jgi:oxygen-independent coproporphyrinogen-3 oxidase
MAPLPDDAPVGIYIHIPFCRHICPYCDFNTYRGLDSLVPRYVDALVHDIASHPRMPAQTVYFGGGTPSLLAPEQIGSSTRTPKSRSKPTQMGSMPPGSRVCAQPG